ncbi:MAG TPA: response regulator, partial [Verrucomicrobiae bacterium]|nr:response regulator [Verrucomicrobiae bacterium]
ARPLVLRNLPQGYFKIGSTLGQSDPASLLVAPLRVDGRVNAVIELGFFHETDPASEELLERISESAGSAIKSANYRHQLQELLEETQRQAEELQSQSEELRVTNEELEEQSRALKESQTRLEQQQAELEQTNSQLEEQTTLLEAQKEDLARAKNSLEAQSHQLEQASQYKSEFLANMSHELRTPLNSSLILAKLLADNRQGNLSAEQVEYAKTIASSGNSLLALINDVLDLAKVEAGRMEVRPQTVRLGGLLDSLRAVFEPLAKQKQLRLGFSRKPDSPDTLETDPQRVEQILKNLLSNAIKFTERGEVSVEVSRAPGGKIAFSVRDSGIGIDPRQREVVFEPFRQADGSTNRKYGGTGLGLSISREFARLLGGEISLTSSPGAGSTFTLLLPEHYDPALLAPGAREKIQPQPVQFPAPRPAVSGNGKLNHIEDDRERLSGDGRIILIVEDDHTFARILSDLAHEMNFQCVATSTADEAVALAAQFSPSAVILDIGLPDHSGLTVLDRLKADSRTRHIPVHVVSANDYSQTALSLGAAGYLLKPVNRERLLEAFEKLETRLTRKLRRVLIVEDDATQRESIAKLLATGDVRAVGVQTAAECLEKLKKETFDCMVLDLNLPDASGFSLLETLSREDAYSFPPVIVYTGCDLTPDQEQQLRKYSKSIIIKGAKSPERLLDEVTLFLHQVVSELPEAQQKMLEKARSRDAALEGKRVLIVEDDVRNIFALTSLLEPTGVKTEVARNGREALDTLDRSRQPGGAPIDLILMDLMMPEMDGLTATREIRKRKEWRDLPIIALTAKAMKGDQEQSLAAGANDYMAKPIDVEKLLSLVRVWMPR